MGVQDEAGHLLRRRPEARRRRPRDPRVGGGAPPGKTRRLSSRCLPRVGERHRPARFHLRDQPVDQPGQRLLGHVAAQRHPVHPAPEPAQHPPVRAHQLGHRDLADPPAPCIAVVTPTVPPRWRSAATTWPPRPGGPPPTAPAAAPSAPAPPGSARTTAAPPIPVTTSPPRPPSPRGPPQRVASGSLEPPRSTARRHVHHDSLPSGHANGHLGALRAPGVRVMPDCAAGYRAKVGGC
jgi:hypothetical protein